jgi:hypothetical protein
MCLEQTSPDPSVFCPTWIARLENILSSIPTFATWRIEELAGLFAQYNTILNQVSSHQVLLRKCDPLLKNRNLIGLAIEKARSDRNWLPFNRAALEMGWDIEILKDVLGIYVQ